MNSIATLIGHALVLSKETIPLFVMINVKRNLKNNDCYFSHEWLVIGVYPINVTTTKIYIPN